MINVPASTTYDGLLWRLDSSVNIVEQKPRFYKESPITKADAEQILPASKVSADMGSATTLTAYLVVEDVEKLKVRNLVVVTGGQLTERSSLLGCALQTRLSQKITCSHE